MIKTIIRVLVFFAVVISLAGCFGEDSKTYPQQQTSQDPGSQSESSQYPAQKVLNVPYFQQQSQNWCWAAAEQMVLAYGGEGVRL